MNEIKNVVSVDFRVPSGEKMDYAFECMKQYQALEMAGMDSKIIYEGVSIPAGYFEDVEDVKELWKEMKKEKISEEKIAQLLPLNIPATGIFDIIISVNSYRSSHDLSICSGPSIRQFREEQNQLKKVIVK